MRYRWTIAALVASLLLVSLSTAADDDWKTRNFNATADQCYEAAMRAVSNHHGVTFKDAKLRVLRYEIGVTSLSWGYRMALQVEPASDGSGEMTACRVTHTVEVKGGPLLSWGRGKKEVQQVYAWMEEELSASFSVRKKKEVKATQN